MRASSELSPPVGRLNSPNKSASVRPLASPELLRCDAAGAVSESNSPKVSYAIVGGVGRSGCCRPLDGDGADSLRWCPTSGIARGGGCRVCVCLSETDTAAGAGAGEHPPWQLVCTGSAPGWMLNSGQPPAVNGHGRISDMGGEARRREAESE